MSSWVSHTENAYARGGWKQPDYDYICRVCGDPVQNEYATDRGITLQACRDCEDRRINQLALAEQELAELKKKMRADWLKVATLAQLRAGELEAK